MKVTAARIAAALLFCALPSAALAQEGAVVELRPDGVLVDTRQIPAVQQGTKLGFVRIGPDRREIGQGSVLAVMDGKALVTITSGTAVAQGDLAVLCPDPSQTDRYQTTRAMAAQARPGTPSAPTAARLRSALAARDAAVQQGACDTAAYDGQIDSLSAQMQQEIRRGPAAASSSDPIDRWVDRSGKAIDQAGSTVDKLTSLGAKLGLGSTKPAAPPVPPPAAPAAQQNPPPQQFAPAPPQYAPVQQYTAPQQYPPAQQNPAPQQNSPAQQNPAPQQYPAPSSPLGNTPAQPDRAIAAFGGLAPPPGAAAAPAPGASSPAYDPAWDFVPGERSIFYDDFSDFMPGGAPPHLKVRGPAVDVRNVADGKQLVVSKPGTLLTASLGSLPPNFTIETEVEFDDSPSRSYRPGFRLQLGRLPSIVRSEITVQLNWVARTGTVKATAGPLLGTAPFRVTPGQKLSLSLWMQDGRVRIYVNNERLVDANQVQLAACDAAWLYFTEVAAPLGVARFRVAESAPDFGLTIDSTGRYVSHGIHFDVDSDRLRPESMPVLKSIAAALASKPALQLRIEGHTDSTGDSAHNQDLSQRRADAVKGALVSQFSVDGGRLATAGQGSNVPLASNDTPDGRATNRRVEFVRQ